MSSRFKRHVELVHGVFSTPGSECIEMLRATAPCLARCTNRQSKISCVPIQRMEYAYKSLRLLGLSIPCLTTSREAYEMMEERLHGVSTKSNVYGSHGCGFASLQKRLKQS
jgi:hypothetical protein